MSSGNNNQSKLTLRKWGLAILIGFGVVCIICGIIVFFNGSDTNYSNEIVGCGFLFVGTSFIINGTSLLVKLGENNKRSRSTLREWESLIFLIGVSLFHFIVLVAIFVLAFLWHGQENKNSLLTPELIHTIIIGSFSLLNLIGGFLFGKMKGEADARQEMRNENSNDK